MSASNLKGSPEERINAWLTLEKLPDGHYRCGVSHPSTCHKSLPSNSAANISIAPGLVIQHCISSQTALILCRRATPFRDPRVHLPAPTLQPHEQPPRRLHGHRIRLVHNHGFGDGQQARLLAIHGCKQDA